MLGMQDEAFTRAKNEGERSSSDLISPTVQPRAAPRRLLGRRGIRRVVSATPLVSSASFSSSSTPHV